MSERMIPIFDGHNDTVLNLRSTGRSFFERSEAGHIDLPRARAGGLAGGLFAVFIPDPTVPIDPVSADVTPYDRPETMPPMMETTYAQQYALTALATLMRLECASDGAVKIVKSAGEVRDCVERGVLAMALHLEGAEPIDTDLDALEVLFRAGVRSLGLVWSRSNRFAHGVPFGFPASPDTGPGLTDAGKELVRACNRLGVLIDLSHLNEQGFWDVAGMTDAPLVATHSCAHAICPSPRNLTDKQLDAVKDSHGLVGINFHVGFLRPDGVTDREGTTVAAIADHVDYVAARVGIDGVALGSDYDGAQMPADLRDAAGLPLLIDELRRRGYDAAAVRKIGTDNWLRIFEQTWRA